MIKQETSVSKMQETFPQLSLMAGLELFWLFNGLRELVRITVIKSEANAIQQQLEAFGFKVCVWRRALIPNKKVEIDQYSISAKTVLLNDPMAQKVVFLIANDIELAKEAESIAGDDRALGKLLGYPTCCVESYLQNELQILQDYSSIYKDEKGPFPFWSNIFLEMFGWSLISHIPCSANCKTTKMMAFYLWNTLKEIDPIYAAVAMSHLRSIVFYSSKLGILYSKDHELIEPQRFRLNHFQASTGWKNLIVDRHPLEITVNKKVLSIGNEFIEIPTIRILNFKADYSWT